MNQDQLYKQDQYYLELAIKEAEIASNNKTYPVGAIIVDPDGKKLSRGHNCVYSDGGDFTSHAEIQAIRDAGSKLMTEQNYGMCTLYTTWEPCLMCSGAILLAKIARIIWARDDNIHGALRHLHSNACSLQSAYQSRLDTLEVQSFNNYKFVNPIDGWMKNWNDIKESIVEGRRKEGSQPQGSLVR